MQWVKIKFCDYKIGANDNKCQLKRHVILGNRTICDLDSLPKEIGEYLVSDGEKISFAKYHMGFENYVDPNYKIPNSKIKYWRSIEDILLPKD